MRYRAIFISDLHLGTPSRRDLLRTPRWRAPLLAELAQTDRLVLLGDVAALAVVVRAALVGLSPEDRLLVVAALGRERIGCTP